MKTMLAVLVLLTYVAIPLMAITTPPQYHSQHTGYAHLSFDALPQATNHDFLLKPQPKPTVETAWRLVCICWNGFCGCVIVDGGCSGCGEGGGGGGAF